MPKHTMARHGANVVVNDLGTSTAGCRAVASHDSVATDEGGRAIVATALDTFGRIDALVHNAGITRDATFDDMTDERLLPVVATHMLGAFFLSRAAWPASLLGVEPTAHGVAHSPTPADGTGHAPRCLGHNR